MPRQTQASLRILMLAACPFPSGQGTQVFLRHLATALGRRGHTMHLVTYGAPAGVRQCDGFMHVAAGTIHVSANSGPSRRRVIADFQLFCEALRILRRGRYDIIFAHNVEAGAIAIMLRAITGVPVVYQAHNAMALELPTYFDSRGARTLASWVGLCLEHIEGQADASIVFDWQHAHRVSRWSRACYVIPPGILIEELGQRRHTCRREKRLTVLYAGNPDGYQNIPRIVSELNIVEETRPSDVELVVLTSEVRRMNNVLSAAKPRFSWGVTECRGPQDLMDAATRVDVAVCARTIPFGAPIKVLNYLALGIPTVAFASGVRSIQASGPLLRVCAVVPGAMARAIEMAATQRSYPSKVAECLDLASRLQTYEQVFRATPRDRFSPGCIHH